MTIATAQRNYDIAKRYFDRLEKLKEGIISDNNIEDIPSKLAEINYEEKYDFLSGALERAEEALLYAIKGGK